ncbi:MAG: hypothetical protein H7Y07_11850 [Pyrinomonadaceae bacterium]|nr:hypothetical protein [Sphingobacteriaceae bacterium]
MKKQPTNIIKLSERFDKQLLNILSQELNTLKSTKNNFLKTLNTATNKDLLVA